MDLSTFIKISFSVTIKDLFLQHSFILIGFNYSPSLSQVPTLIQVLYIITTIHWTNV